METGHFKELGDRLKALEAGSETTLLPGVPVVARLDGRAFHTFTRGLNRPYDRNLQALMQETMCDLVTEFKPDCGYTQSDEITLVWASRAPEFSGRVQKLVSLLAARASAFFCRRLPELLPERGAELPTFDARVFSVASELTALEVLMWRQEDAVKNSISMLAQSHFSSKELHGRDRHQMLAMLDQKGIAWASENQHFKRGVFARRLLESRFLTAGEVAGIPEPHRAKALDAPVVRSQVRVLDLAPIRRIPFLSATEALFGALGVGISPEVVIPSSGSVLRDEGLSVKSDKGAENV